MTVAASDVPPHSRAFRLRRFWNWFPLGLTYAFLYMGRYNLTVAKNALGDLMTKEDFGIIFGAGTFTYAFAFLINGPLTDRIGGKRAILIAASGSALMNAVMGSIGAAGLAGGHLRLVYSVLYAVNMYFQSFGAVAIVKVNAHWFHVRERGGFSGIFGTMISSGLWFAFTVNGWILEIFKSPWSVFFAPAAILLAMAALEIVLLRDRPSQAGLEDFDTADASSGEEGVEVPLRQVLKRILTNPIILTVALVEFCTGVLRNGVMHWFQIYATEVWALPKGHYLMFRGPEDMLGLWPCWLVGGAILGWAARRVARGQPSAWAWVVGGLVALAPWMEGGWGGWLMVAGVIGGNLAGWVSDLFFQSRRAPAAGGLYLGLGGAAVLMAFSLGSATNEVGWVDVDKEPSLRAGDRIVSIAGAADIEDWSDVSRAVACLPAICQDGALWDTERCLCAGSPYQTRDDLPTSDGTIAVTVRRDGKEVALALRDPKPRMRAGDARKLAAGPTLTVDPLWLGLLAFFISLCVIGTHGLLSGTATMDFGGRRGAATAVGMIDGFVYLGTGVQSVCLGYLTTRDWSYWPWFLFPFAALGFTLLTRVWHAKPKPRGGR